MLTFHENVGDILDDVVGGEQDENGEEKRADRIDPLQVRVEVDHESGYHYAQTLYEVADHMDERSSYIQILRIFMRTAVRIT